MLRESGEQPLGWSPQKYYQIEVFQTSFWNKESRKKVRKLGYNNETAGSWSFDYETSAQRPHNVGLVLMCNMIQYSNEQKASTYFEGLVARDGVFWTIFGDEASRRMCLIFLFLGANLC